MDATIHAIAPYAKAVIAAVVAFLSVLASGLVADGLSWGELVAALIAFFVALGAVFSVPNRPPFTPEPAPSVEVAKPEAPRPRRKPKPSA